MKKYSDDELIKISAAAPGPVREAIEDIGTSKIVAQIAQTKSLHIDQIGRTAELNTLMLLGLISPQDFLQELIAARIPEASARQIIDEINKRIFIPLHEKMRSGGTDLQQLAKPIPTPTPQVNASVPNYAPPTPGLPKRNEIPQGSVKPLVPVVAPVATLPPKIILPNPTSPKASQGTGPNASLRDALQKALPVGEMTAVTSTPKPIVQPAAPRPITPPAPLPVAASSAPMRVFRKEVPPAQAPAWRPPQGSTPVNLPGSMPPVQAPAPFIPKPPATPAAPSKPYSADPYREPIEP